MTLENETAVETHRRRKERNVQAMTDFFTKGSWTYVMHHKKYAELFTTAEASELDAVTLTKLGEKITIGTIGIAKLVVSFDHQSEKIYKVRFGGDVDREGSIGTGLFPLIGEIIAIEEITIQELRHEMKAFAVMGVAQQSHGIRTNEGDT